MFSWFLTYPLDSIKTRVQNENITLLNAFNKGHLYNGLTVCLLRSFFVNSIGFFIYEKINE